MCRDNIIHTMPLNVPQAKPKVSRKSSGGGGVRRSSSAEMDPERLFSKLQRIGKGNFGEVYKG